MVRARPGGRAGRAQDAADPLRKGSLRFRQHGVEVELLTAEGVFSAAAVDPGTTYLLRWLADVEAGTVLDVGCGYGPLALWLVAADPARRAVAVDRDAVALACTADGASANGLADRVQVLGSLGYDDLDPDARFDLVVSNVPAKVGAPALRHLLLDSWYRLAPGGRVAIVVVARLVEPVAALLAAEPAVVVETHHANRSYGTWTYRFEGEPAGDPRPGFERGVYRRGSSTFAAGRTRWEAATSSTLAEFDTLSHSTVATVELLERHRLPGPVGVLGTGQGHVPLALRAVAGGDVELRLVDRDLLALRTTAANVGGGVELHHLAQPAGSVTGCGAIVVALPEKEPVGVTAALLQPALAALAPRTPVVLHGRAADVARVLDVLARRDSPLAVEDRRARAGGVAAFTVTPPR